MNSINRTHEQCAECTMRIPGVWRKEGTGRPDSMPVFMKEIELQLSHDVGGQETEDNRSREDI